ncbi:hypothetical protein Tco_0349355 [Tanacetum coccineum]
MCLTGKDFKRFEDQEDLVLQILWGVKPKSAPAKHQEKKRKPLSESSEAPPLAKRAKAGKVVKKRTVKSSKQMVDEFVDEGVHAAKPSLEDTEGGDTAKEVPGKGNRSDTDLMNEMPSVVRSGALEKPGWTKPLIDVAES